MYKTDVNFWCTIITKITKKKLSDYQLRKSKMPLTSLRNSFRRKNKPQKLKENENWLSPDASEKQVQVSFVSWISLCKKLLLCMREYLGIMAWFLSKNDIQILIPLQFIFIKSWDVQRSNEKLIGYNFMFKWLWIVCIHIIWCLSVNSTPTYKTLTKSMKLKKSFITKFN